MELLSGVTWSTEHPSWRLMGQNIYFVTISWPGVKAYLLSSELALEVGLRPQDPRNFLRAPDLGRKLL